MALFLAVLARFAVVAHVARVLFGKLELIAHQRFGWRVAPLASNDNAANSALHVKSALALRTGHANVEKCATKCNVVSHKLAKRRRAGAAQTAIDGALLATAAALAAIVAIIERQIDDFCSFAHFLFKCQIKIFHCFVFKKRFFGKSIAFCQTLPGCNKRLATT